MDEEWVWWGWRSDDRWVIYATDGPDDQNIRVASTHFLDNGEVYEIDMYACSVCGGDN